MCFDCATRVDSRQWIGEDRHYIDIETHESAGKSSHKYCVTMKLFWPLPVTSILPALPSLRYATSRCLTESAQLSLDWVQCMSRSRSEFTRDVKAVLDMETKLNKARTSSLALLSRPVLLTNDWTSRWSREVSRLRGLPYHLAAFVRSTSVEMVTR